MFELKYDSSKNEIVQVDPDGNSEVLASDFPSKPISSPDNKKAIFINPLEWEVPGSLYLYNFENGSLNEIIQPDENQNIPKYADWLDEDNIAVIIGYGMGTVAVGGNVYIYNIPNGSLEQITSYQSEIQITKLKIHGETIELTGIKYIDDILNEFKDFEDTISINLKSRSKQNN